MFDNTDNPSTLAQAAYKRYVDRKLRYTAVFHNGDKMFLKLPSTEDKKQKEKEENIAQSKLRFKRTGPYEV